MTSNMWLSPSHLGLLMSNMHKISASWRCPGHHWFRDQPNEAKWVKMECLLLCFLHELTALFSMTASLITLKLLSATREAFALSVDSSQEVVLHMSPLKQLRECPLIPFLLFNFWPTLTVWHRLLKSLFLSQFLDGSAHWHALQYRLKPSRRDGRRSSEQAARSFRSSWNGILAEGVGWR